MRSPTRRNPGLLQHRSYRVELLAAVQARRPNLDRDFLPAALEILERPTSPVRIGLLYAICACFAFAIAWSYFGRLNEYASATGKVEVQGRTKVVQPLRSGKVLSIAVADGSRVAAGDVLLRLDPAEAASSFAAVAGDFLDVRVEVARRTAAIEAARSLLAGRRERPPIAWPDDVPPDVRRREQAVLDADLAQLDASVDSLAAQLAQQEADRDKTAASIAAETALVAVLSERVDMRTQLVAKQAMSRAQVLDSLQELRQAQTTLVSLKGSLNGALAAIAAAEAQRRKTVSAFIADNADQRQVAQRKAADLTQQVARSEAELADMTLRAPTAGTVQALAVTTIGQVVTTGQELLSIVPTDSPLEIQAYILNQDAGFVKEGQKAVIKVDALPFTRYGTLEGTVTYVAKDAIPGLDASQQQYDPIKAPAGSLSALSAAQRTQDLVFPIRISPTTTSLNVDGKMMPISAGMTVNVEVQTDTRRIIDYILSPLEEVGSTALRER